MVWFKVDDRLPMNRKMAGVSLAAVGLWVEGGSWASGAQTGGTIPKQLLRLLHVESSEKLADELVAAGLWEDEGDQWRIHDFFDYNPTAKEIEDLKASRSKAGRSGGLKSGESRRSKREANREAKSKQNRSKPRSKNEAVPVPVPYISTNVDISPKPPTGVESDKEQIREPSSEPTVEFTQFWSLYPNHDYEDAAVREFRRVRRQRVSLPALLQGAQMLRDEHRDPRYIPAASKWLHDGGWKNKPKPKPRAPASSPGMSKSQQNLLHNQQVVERIISQERAGTMQDTGRRELTT